MRHISESLSEALAQLEGAEAEKLLEAIARARDVHPSGSWRAPVPLEQESQVPTLGAA